jgi:hypothetical protein
VQDRRTADHQPDRVAAGMPVETGENMVPVGHAAVIREARPLAPDPGFNHRIAATGRPRPSLFLQEICSQPARR